MYVVPSLNIGGRERVVLELITRLDRNKFDVELCCLKGRGSFSDLFSQQGIQITYFGKGKNWDVGMYYRLRNFLKDRQIDIVHIHNPGALVYAAVGAIWAGVPVIINSEHGYEYVVGGLKRYIEMLIRSCIDVTISVSEALSVHLFSGLFLRKKITVIHNGIDTSVYEHNESSSHLSLRERFNFSKSDIIIGNVARLARIKNHRMLLETMKLIVKEVQAAKLLIVGDGILRNELEVYSRSIGISDNVFFWGEANNVPELLQLMDVFVLSSNAEGISMTILEAMASGKAVVATNVGGNPEIIKNDVTGILVPPNDPEAMAEAVLSLLRDRERLSLLGLEGKRRVKECFNIETAVKKTEELYISLFREKTGNKYNFQLNSNEI